MYKCEFWGSQTDFQIYLSAFIEYSQSDFTKWKLHSAVKRCSLLEFYVNGLDIGRLLNKAVCLYLQAVHVLTGILLRLGQGISVVASMLEIFPYPFNIFAFCFYLKDTAKKVVVNLIRCLLTAILKDNEALLLLTYILCITNE